MKAESCFHYLSLIPEQDRFYVYDFDIYEIMVSYIKYFPSKY